MHYLNCKRTPQQAKVRFVAEPATLLFLFELLCCFGFHAQIDKTLYYLKALQKAAKLRNLQPNVWNPELVCGIQENK